MIANNAQEMPHREDPKALETIAILKPGKYSAIPTSYRPMSLLYHTYKLYERMILNRVTPLLEQNHAPANCLT